MATDDPIRASDVDRDVVVAALRDAYTAGRLTLDEFDERISAAYSGKTWGDLRKLTIDLPTQPILGTDVPGRPLPPAAGIPPYPRRPAPEPDAVTRFSQQPPQPPARPRRRPVGILIPAAIWILLMLHGVVGPGVVFVLVIVLVLGSIMSSGGRRLPRTAGRGQQPAELAAGELGGGGLVEQEQCPVPAAGTRGGQRVLADAGQRLGDRLGLLFA